MGPFCNKKRVQDSFYKETLSFPNSCFSQADRKSSTRGRGQRTPTQRGSGENKPGRSRILLSNFPGSQEKREITTYNRSVQTEFLSEHSVFQNGNGKQSQAIDSTQRLGIFTGFNRCLSPCTYSLAVSKIPPLLYQGSDIPIQGSTLRSSHESVCLHTLDGYHSNSSAAEISRSVSIFGRLVGQKSNSGRYPQRSAVHHQADFISRTNNQRKEVRFNSCPEFCFYRDGISDSQEHSSSAMGQSTRHSESCTLVQETRTSISKTIPVSSGEVKCSCSICCFGQATLTSSSNGSFCSVETSCSTIRTLHSDQYANQESFGVVEQQRKVCPGCTSETTPAISHSFHRRQSLRMGCPSGTGGTSVSWCLVSGPISATHQCFGDESHSVSSKTVSSTCQQYHSHDSHGQFISGSLFEEAGGYPFSISLHGGLGNSSVVRQEKHKPSCSPRARQIQHTGRSAESSVQTNFDRMVFGSGCLQPSSISYRLPKHRPVCDSSQQQTTSLCFPYSRRQSSSNRCSINELGPDPCVRISSVRSDSGNNQQDSSTSVQNCSSSPILARSILVPRVTSATSSTSHQASCKTASVNTTAVCEKQYRKPQTPRLDIVRKSIRDRSFSEKVAEHASKARRVSTRKVYDLKWNIFSRWCRIREIDPVMASPGNVADFLLHMFQEKKCQVSTVKGYRSTISNTLKFKSGQNIGSDPIISELIKYMELQRPIQRSLAPKWDLSCVLSSLCGEPFEPLHRASRFYLTLKTVFLLAMATARRVSEIHALSIDPGHLRFNQSDGSVSLRTEPGFLAKNQLPSICPDDIWFKI